jgi:hypothetical protein
LGTIELARVIKAQATVRRKVAGELLDTERSYVTSMRNMAKLLICPIQDSTKRGAMILTEKEQFDIFANVLELLDGHEAILAALSARIENWTEQCVIGDILVQHVCELHTQTETETETQTERARERELGIE